MGAQQYIQYADWGGGDSGRERPTANDLTRYRGVNVWRYPNGAIGPRPPWTPFTITGLPTGATLRVFMVKNTTVGTLMVWAYTDGRIYTTTLPTLAATLKGTMANAPIDGVIAGDVAYLLSETAGGASYNVATATYAAVAGMPAGQCIVEFAQQLVILRSATCLIRWSALNDGSSWPAANAQFVGSGASGQGLYVQRDMLVVAKGDGDIWAFTGVLGVNESLRRVDRGRTHPSVTHTKGAVTGNSVLYFTTGSDMLAFTGAQAKPMPRPDLAEQTGFYSGPLANNQGNVVALERPNTFVVLGAMDSAATETTKRGWMQHFSPEAGWTRHTVALSDWSVHATAMASFNSTDSARALKCTIGSEGAVYIATPSDANFAGSAIQHALMLTTLERPYLTSAQRVAWLAGGLSSKDGSGTAPVVATFSSAEWWAPEGRDCTLRSLVIDYSYDTDTLIATELGAQKGHHFDITVTALQRDPNGAPVTSSSVSFDPSGGSAIDGGTLYRARATFTFGDQGSGGGFRFNLADWRGIMIHQVTAGVDVDGARA